jgi:hypothetical protein
MGGFLIIALVVGGTWLLIEHMASRPHVVYSQEQKNYLAATPQNLKYLGLDFVPMQVSDSRARGAITSEQAIAAALKEEPGLKAATSVSSMLGVLNNLNLQQAANQGVTIGPNLAAMGLVWIVTFEGVDTSSSGPSQAPRYVSHEYDVVIDAKTGAYIMAFPLYDITPSASIDSSLQMTDVTKYGSQLPGPTATPRY